MSVFLQHKEMLLKNDSLSLKSKKQLYKITAKDLVARCLDCCVIIKQKDLYCHLIDYLLLNYFGVV